MTDEELAKLIGETQPAVGGSGPTEGAPMLAEASGTQPQPADPGLGRAFLAAFGQGGLKGGSDELAGVLGSAMVGEGTGQPGSQYRRFRDQEREQLRAGQEYHPYASFVGDLAGDIGSDWLLSLAGVPVTSPQYQTAVGGLSGLMRGEADLSQRETTPEAMALTGGNVALGAGLGYIAPKIGERVARQLLPGLAARGRRALENFASSEANKVLLSGARSLANKMPVSGQALLQALEDRAIVPFGTVRGAAQRLEDLGERRGAMYGAILQRLEELGVRGPKAEPLARAMTEEARRRAANSGSNKAVAEVFQKEADNIRALAQPPPTISLAAAEAGGRGATELGLGQAENIKRALQREAKYGRIEDTPLNDAKKDVASRVRQAIEDTVEQARLEAPANSELAEVASEFVPIKRSLANTLEAEAAARAGAARFSNRSPVGLLAATMASGGGAAAGADLLSRAAGMASKAAEAGVWQAIINRGGSTAASAAYNLSRALPQYPGMTREFVGALARQKAYADELKKKGKKE